MRQLVLIKYSILFSLIWIMWLFGATYHIHVDMAKSRCAFTMSLFSCHNNSIEATELRAAELQVGDRMPVPYLTLNEQETNLCCDKSLRCQSLLLLYRGNHPASHALFQAAEAEEIDPLIPLSVRKGHFLLCIFPGGWDTLSFMAEPSWCRTEPYWDIWGRFWTKIYPHYVCFHK